MKAPQALRDAHAGRPSDIFQYNRFRGVLVNESEECPEPLGRDGIRSDGVREVEMLKHIEQSPVRQDEGARCCKVLGIRPACRIGSSELTGAIRLGRDARARSLRGRHRGAIADATSLVAAIWIIGAIALVPLAGALLLPRDERVR